jgi:hypothetical protein
VFKLEQGQFLNLYKTKTKNKNKKSPNKNVGVIYFVPNPLFHQKNINLNINNGQTHDYVSNKN